MMRQSCLLLLAVCAGLGAGPATAHDIWLNGADGAVQVHYGHPGDLTLPDKARLFELNVHAAPGTATLLDDLAVAKHAPILVAPLPAPAHLVAGRFDNGFWTQTPHGMKNTNRRVAPGPRSIWSMKFAKLLLPGGSAAAYTQPLGHRLELVPLDNPFALQPGMTLRLRVLFEDKPLAGAKLELGTQKLESDAKGEASIPVAAGETLLLASHRSSGSLPELAAEDTLAASLVFRR